MAKIKCKNMMYVQQTTSMSAKTKEDLAKLVKEKLKPKKSALILHDKDIDENGNPEADHIHLMLSFENARYIDSIAKILKDKPQYIEKWDGLAENGFAYLVHATESANDKYQYNPNEVIANFDYVQELKKITKAVTNAANNSKSSTLLDSFYAGVISRDEAEKSMTGTQYGKFSRQLDAIENKRMQEEAQAWIKQKIEEHSTVKTIWLFGTEGTGKTSLARQLAENKGDKPFITGSSRDIFQGYKGEHTIILEELRPFNFNYEDFLRITDPYGFYNQVMLPSRYKDKMLACDLIIITSPYDPWNYYDQQFHVSTSQKDGCVNPAILDNFGQLKRRISLTIYADLDYTYATQFDSAIHQYEVIDGSEKPNPYSSKQRPASIIDPLDLYNSIID